MKTFFDCWKSYEAEVVPPDAGPVQREECRRAFYAGGAMAFSLSMEAVAPDDEEECALNLTQLEAELNSIVTDLRQV